MSTVMEATELDGKGLDEVKLLTDAIRTHQVQIQDLGKRRKQLILRLRKQRITYREIAEAMGVSERVTSAFLPITAWVASVCCGNRTMVNGSALSHSGFCFTARVSRIVPS